jgi:hypothetical protein
MENKIIRYARTAHTRPVYASPPYGGPASATARSFRYASFPRQNAANSPLEIYRKV